MAYAECPAINWFTPLKAKKLLKKAGFKIIYDRWDMIDPNKERLLKKILVKFARLNIITRYLAGMFFGGCEYCAIK